MFKEEEERGRRSEAIRKERVAVRLYFKGLYFKSYYVFKGLFFRRLYYNLLI